MLWKVFPAHKYVAVTVVSWGTVASLRELQPSVQVTIMLNCCRGIVCKLVVAGDSESFTRHHGSCLWTRRPVLPLPVL